MFRLFSPETVYGLGANALSGDAVLKIFQVCPSTNDKRLIITAMPLLLPHCCPYLSHLPCVRRSVLAASVGRKNLRVASPVAGSPHRVEHTVHYYIAQKEKHALKAGMFSMFRTSGCIANSTKKR